MKKATSVKTIKTAKTKSIKATKRERDAIFVQLCEELDNWVLQSVADASGVSHATLYLWLNGTTTSPHLRTISAVAKAIGMELRLVPAALALVPVAKAA